MPPTFQKDDDELADFQLEPFTSEPSATPGDATKPVYWIGDGPGVLLMPEIPGITPEVADFARRLATEGFTVAVPSLFGQPGRAGSTPRAGMELLRACVSREFTAFATGVTSPVTPWLRALAHHIHQRCGGPGIGAIGMCLTGGFVLGLAMEPSVLVPVLSQPSLPLPLGRKRRRDLGVSPSDLKAAQEHLTDGQCAIGLRFTGDPMVPRHRFERLQAELGDGFIGVEIDSSGANSHGIARDAHSVLTMEFRDEPDHPTRQAYDLVVEHFRVRLIA